jgi:hypothetical protein
MLWTAISVTEVIMPLLGGTTLMSFRGILVLTGVHVTLLTPVRSGT